MYIYFCLVRLRHWVPISDANSATANHKYIFIYIDIYIVYTHIFKELLTEDEKERERDWLMQVKRAWITEGRLRVGELLCIYNINYVALSLSLFNLLTRPLNHSCSVSASVQSSWSFQNINLQCSEFVFIKLSIDRLLFYCAELRAL